MNEGEKGIATVCESFQSNGNVEPSNEERFRQINAYERPPEKSFGERIKGTAKCDSKRVQKVFPILEWLPAYARADLASDVVAGLTVGVMHIPQGMAYALLGGVPPVVGIYMAFFPVLVYIAMGTSRHVSMGTFAVVCMLVGKSVDEFAREPNASVHVAGNSSLFTPTEVASAVCFVAGIWQVVLSLFRLGALSVLLSGTLVSGFTTGAAIHVATSQIRNLLGIEVKRYSGPLKIIYSYADVFANLADVNVAAAILSVSFILILVTFNEFLKPLAQKKLKRTIPFPIELVVVIAGTLLSAYLNVKENYGVAIVEFVPKGFPDPAVPPMNLVLELLTDGFVVAVVAVSINVSMASMFAQKKGYDIDGNQEILASGVGNVFASFFSCMPFAASLSRSLVQVTAGGQTQVASAVSCLFLVFIMLFVGPYFEPLPYCVLSTIIVVALKGMFVQVMDVPDIFRKSKLDGFVWIATFLSVVIIDVRFGLVIGLSSSAGTLILRSGKFDILLLGFVPQGKTYVDADRFKKAERFEDVLILRIVGGLHFANANRVRSRLSKEIFDFHGKIRLPEEAKQRKRTFVIIDLSCVPFIDPSAARSLESAREEVKLCRSDLFISGCQPSVYDELERFDFFIRFPKSMVFHDLDGAVECAIRMTNEPKGPDEFILRI